METFGKAPKSSATVGRVGRLAALSLVLLAGIASSLQARPGAGGAGTTTAAAATTLPASSVVVFTGHGWGHGLGLSQWGAYGYAKHGWTYDRILGHYYTGTALGQATVSTIRVLLTETKQTTLASSTAWTVTDATGAKVALDPGTVVLKPKLALAGHADVRPPLTFAAAQPIAVGGHPFRGRLVVASDGKVVRLVDVLGLEAYLKGVVPQEMPSAWPPEALKAQAVAARSYALANVHKGQPFDVYGDTRDQVYGGVDAESANASAAVDATRGQVVVYDGQVANTLFFSTSGGRTASALESTGRNVPYLVPVADPYDTASPYHDWGPVLLDGAKVAKLLKLASPIAGLEATNGPSGRVKTLRIVGDDESQVTLTGGQVRGALELRSTWFTPALLRLLPAAKTVTYGGGVSLTGSAQGADRASLEAKPAGAAGWADAGELLLGADGSFSTIQRPQITTRYRLAWGDVRAGLTTILVAPRVDAAPAGSGVAGRIRPAVASAPVQLQRQSGSAWTTLFSTVTDASGAFSFGGALAAGTYRVRSAPGHGLVAGVSQPVAVS